MADNSGTTTDEAHGFEPHHDQHVYFRKRSNAKEQLNPFSPGVDRCDSASAKKTLNTCFKVSGGAFSGVFRGPLRLLSGIGCSRD
jgi:hypothetical protein